MISYRVSLGVGLLRPGVTPDVVLPAAAAAARERTVVESSDLTVVGGVARIHVRFLASDDGAAGAVARAVRGTVDALATVAAPELNRRYGPRWHPVRWPK